MIQRVIYPAVIDYCARIQSAAASHGRTSRWSGGCESICASWLFFTLPEIGECQTQFLRVTSPKPDEALYYARSIMDKTWEVGTRTRYKLCGFVALFAGLSAGYFRGFKPSRRPCTKMPRLCRSRAGTSLMLQSGFCYFAGNTGRLVQGYLVDAVVAFLQDETTCWVADPDQSITFCKHVALTVFLLETLRSCLPEIHVERPQVVLARQTIQQKALFWSSLCEAKGRPVHEQGTSFAPCFRRFNAASRLEARLEIRVQSI